MDKIYSKKFPVYTYDVGPDGKARLPVLLNFLQEAARDHAALLKVSIFDLQAKGLTWVISRYHIRVPRYPSMGDSVEVLTWPSSKKGVFAIRDFEARDASGRLLLEATSSWIVISLDSKQPVKVDTLFLDESIFDRRAIADDFARLPGPARTDHEAFFQVLSRDLDFNHHANNVSYVSWALEGLPEEVLRARRATEIEIVYKAEALYGDKVACRTEFPAGEGSVFLQELVNPDTGVELARLRMSFE
jgi:medium-chain acyl-[acyl-carrier-protein] hydrolase